jgi:hypothetical protein
MESIKAGDAMILALEQTFERILNHPTLPFPVLIKVMSTESKNATVIRIIDYKTGKVEKSSVMLKAWKD